MSNTQHSKTYHVETVTFMKNTWNAFMEVPGQIGVLTTSLRLTGVSARSAKQRKQYVISLGEISETAQRVCLASSAWAESTFGCSGMWCFRMWGLKIIFSKPLTRLPRDRDVVFQDVGFQNAIDAVFQVVGRGVSGCGLPEGAWVNPLESRPLKIWIPSLRVVIIIIIIIKIVVVIMNDNNNSSNNEW